MDDIQNSMGSDLPPCPHSYLVGTTLSFFCCLFFAKFTNKELKDLFNSYFYEYLTATELNVRFSIVFVN